MSEMNEIRRRINQAIVRGDEKEAAFARAEFWQTKAESLQRENEELKEDFRCASRNAASYCVQLAEAKAAAITPEMREKAEAALSEYVHWQRYGKCVEVVRDLLGEWG